MSILTPIVVCQLPLKLLQKNGEADPCIVSRSLEADESKEMEDLASGLSFTVYTGTHSFYVANN